MSNHFHLLLQLADPKKLSSLLAGLLRSYVHYYNRRYGFCGHLWQGRFNKAPTIFQGAPDGALNKRGRTYPVNDPHAVQPDLDPLNERSDDRASGAPVRLVQAAGDVPREILQTA